MLRIFFRAVGLSMTIMIVALTASPAFAEKRLALVVGVDKYLNLPDYQQLRKAVNDARAVSATLRSVGFEVVAVENASRIDFIRAWQRYLNQIEKGDVVALFFAGHGVEISGQNYLLPADIPVVQAGEEEILKAASMNFDALLHEMQKRGARLNLVMLDACRDNPFATATGRSLGTSRGLASVQPASGTFVMYSAGLGQSALDRLSDDDQNPNSIYTRELLPLLKQPGLSLLQVATRVRRRVRDTALTVNHNQVPAYYDEVIRDFYLAGRQVDTNAGNETDNTAPTTLTTTPDSSAQLACQRAIMDDKLETYEAYLRRYSGTDCYARIQRLYEAKVEKTHWDRARTEDSITAYKRYLIAFPRGIYADQAENWLKTLKDKANRSTNQGVDVANIDRSADYNGLKKFEGYDVYGGDYRQLKKVRLRHCIAACAGNSRCRAYTYNSRHRLCFLKKSVGTLMPTYEAISGVRRSDAQGIRLSRIRVIQNTDVQGWDYRNIRQISFLRCYQTCESERQCRSFAYVQNSAVCWLKTGAQGTRRKKGVTLGIKE